MTPLYFRACVLITDKIISYSEFLNMTYFDFRRLEALIVFKNKQINKPKGQNKNKIKSQLSGLASRSVSDMGFTKEQLDMMF
mgnify:CR=1 FL=1|jgi:hypothetical protein